MLVKSCLKANWLLGGKKGYFAFHPGPALFAEKVAKVFPVPFRIKVVFVQD